MQYPQARCRVLFLAPQKARAARVAQLIADQQEGGGGIQTQDGDVVIEILPAVATFSSYLDEEERAIRYLSSVDYYGPQATFAKPSSLLSFFDEEEPAGAETATDLKPRVRTQHLFSGISGVAVGAGLDGVEDVSMIQKFFNTVISKHKISMEVIQPNPEYETMEQELSAFRQMSTEEKEEGTRSQQIGPGKMAKFVIDFALRVVKERMAEVCTQAQGAEAQTSLVNTGSDRSESSPPTNETTISTTNTVTPATPIIDPSQTRYSCRRCRTILFGEDELEYPPHSQAKHRFSARKMNHGGTPASNRNTSSMCQSLFLQDGAPWMGDMSSFEGKFACPKCDTKLGTWDWSGSQCSCGTWVVPAIQVPKSKVDEISSLSLQVGLPAGTVVSPFVRVLPPEGAL
ncbi:hypothetical protein ACA910_017805 [Epithemia clementina (nom. ined.)]